MKRLFCVLFLFFAFISAGAAEQAAGTGRCPDAAQLHAYEPWMFELVKSRKDEAATYWWHKLAALFKSGAPAAAGAKKIDAVPAQIWQRTRARLTQLAQEQGKNESDVERRYVHLQSLINANPLLGKVYALWVSPAAADDVNHLSDESFTLLQKVLGTRPDARAERPAAQAAWKVQDDFIRVEFKNGDETVHLGFDLQKHTLEIYQNLPAYGVKDFGVRTNLTDWPPFCAVKTPGLA